METEAIDNQANLVNYDNENEYEIKDLGYESEKYTEDAHEDDEKNHSNGYAKSGITRLCKFCGEYGKLGGVKLSVTFDALNRILEKHRALFSSFLGDMVREHIGLQILSWKKVDPEAKNKLWDEITRYFDVDLTVRKLVMNRLGQLLRNFRRKLRQTYILPNQDTPSKLNDVPVKYSAILKAEDWVNFVNYTATEEYKVKSAKAKMARSKCVFPHTMGRGGYAHVKEKMIEKKEIEQDEEPTRGTLWLKGRVNKDGEYQDDEIRSVGDKLENEDKFDQKGPSRLVKALMPLVHCICKGKGKLCKRSGESGVDTRDVNVRERTINQEYVHQDVTDRGKWCHELKISWLQKGWTVSPVEIHPINSSADEEGGTTVLGCDQNDASIRKEMQKRAIKCRLWHLKKTTIIAEGTVYKSDGKIMLHNKALPKDCYKVSIDKSLVDAAFIPDVGSNGCTTVLDAVGGFVAWPKNQVVFYPKATPPSTIQMITVENKTAPKVPTKRKNFYVSSDVMQKEANKKRSHKALVY
ncbi:transposase, Ptta/En/Spm, transposase, Tnp1/En/Spm-like protein [Tanacetum coccineum]